MVSTLSSILSVGIFPSFLKKRYYRMRGARIGKGVTLGFLSLIDADCIEIGNHSRIGMMVRTKAKEFKIGSYTQISHSTTIAAPQIRIGNQMIVLHDNVIEGMNSVDSRFIIGNRCAIFPFSWLNPKKNVIIGNCVGIGGSNQLFTNGMRSNALEGFPFHEHCGFCGNECQQIKTDSDYLLITNIWNEHDNIPKTFHRVSAQSKKPKVWLWIDDGSTDGSSDVIRDCASLLPDVDIWIESMPSKPKGNLDTIGRAYDRILPRLKDKVNRTNISYIGIMDVDNNPCPNYFARLLWLLERHPKIGAAAGIPLGEVGKRRVGLPMGAGKLIRWSIVQRIDRYWDIAPDTLFNIKAISFGYSVKTFPIPMGIDRLTKAFSKSGAFRQGRLSYYVGRPFWAVLFRSVRRLLLFQFGTQMLRGYFYERRRGTWRFDDPDIARFYGKGGNPITALLEVFSYVGMHE